jgi:hypothetical protein
MADNLSFLYRGRYFLIQVAPYYPLTVYSTVYFIAIKTKRGGGGFLSPVTTHLREHKRLRHKTEGRSSRLIYNGHNKSRPLTDMPCLDSFDILP